MKLYLGVEVLFVSLAFHIVTGDNGSSDGDTLTADLELLRKDFQAVRMQLHSRIKERDREQEILQQKIAELQRDVNQLRSERASLLNISQGLSTGQRISELTRIDLEGLKRAVRLNSAQLSALQIAAGVNHTDQEASLSDLRNNQSGCGCRPGVPENEIAVPVLRFAQIYGHHKERVVIEADGTVVKDIKRRRPAWGTNVRAHGLLSAAARQYWQVELTWSKASEPSYPGWFWVGGPGVKVEGSLFPLVLGDDDQSFAVRIRHNPGLQKWRYECRHNNTSFFVSEHVRFRKPEVTNRLGFLLDAANKTLTIVEVDNNAPLCSLPIMDESAPLVPAVYYGSGYYKRRFYLPAVDPCRLPEVILDKNNTHTYRP